MANSVGSKKRARQAIKRNSHNAKLRTRLRTFIKKTLKVIEAKEKILAIESFSALKRVIDQASAKGLIHKNSAARKKSRISAKIKAL